MASEGLDPPSTDDRRSLPGVWSSRRVGGKRASSLVESLSAHPTFRFKSSNSYSTITFDENCQSRLSIPESRSPRVGREECVSASVPFALRRTRLFSEEDLNVPALESPETSVLLIGPLHALITASEEFPTLVLSGPLFDEVSKKLTLFLQNNENPTSVHLLSLFRQSSSEI